MNVQTTAQAVDEASGLAVVRALGPRIAAAGEEIDAGRRLPPGLVAAMVEAGLFRVALPRSVGGAEVDLLTLLSLAEALGRADGSTGWCFVQGTLSAAQVVGFLPPETAEEIFGGTGQTVLANGTGPGGTAVAVPGGYRLSGRWLFASGCTHATWFKGLARVVGEDGAAVLRSDGTAEQRTMLFPAAPQLLEDNWQVSGLRGTGSQTIVVDGLFVPGERTASLTHDRQRESGALYHLPSSGVAAASFSSVAMGIARGALDAFVDLAAHKAPRGGARMLREDVVVQAQVAQAEARLRGARAFLREVSGDVWETVRAGEALTERQRALFRLAATNGTQDAAGVVDVVYHAAGATAIFAAQGFERRFRDVHAITQQIQAHQIHFQAVGRHFLGMAVESGYV